MTYVLNTVSLGFGETVTVTQFQLTTPDWTRFKREPLERRRLLMMYVSYSYVLEVGSSCLCVVIRGGVRFGGKAQGGR